MKKKQDPDMDFCIKKCNAMCCTGISVPIDMPKKRDEIEELRFYILHKNVEIYLRSNRWYILIDEKCMNLGRNNLCKEYDKRPLICRKHSNKECEYWGDYYDVRFKTESELMEYFDKKAEKRRKKRVQKKTKKVKK